MAERSKKKPIQPRQKSRPPSVTQPAAPAVEWADPDESLPEPSSATAAFPIVGIGASAGGLESFTQLLHQIPITTDLAFVLVQHLDPTHESMLPELLSRVTKMSVQRVRDGMVVEPNKVYVAPSNVDMAMKGLQLKLQPRSQTRGLHMPIDRFFRSLAQEHGSCAIGIILSGTGSDGALGLAEIKEQGGITFVQDERTAKFPGMPHSAIMNGGIDFILPPAGIAQELARVAQHPYVISPFSGREKDAAAEPPPIVESTSPDGLDRVYRLLRGTTGVDFSFYKQSTIRRRITRRMTLRKMDSLEEYAQYIREHPEELDALYHDLLIKVTGFFRDPETFEALKSRVFPTILRDRPANKPIRIWVPGCASGEECYSIVMCLLESLGDRVSHTPIQVFATDIDDIALAKARTGRYIENIALDISPERLRRFFTKVDQQYQIMQAIREVCTFARHDLCRDPPFSNLDLISCRNVLIYLEPAMQKRVVPLFHYALTLNGFLALGVSESIGTFSDLFTLVDRKQKIFTKKLTALRPAFDFSFPRLATDQAEAAGPRMGVDEPLLAGVDVYKEADRLVLKQYAPAGVLIDEQMDILQFRGDTSHYLRPAPGKASLNLLQMAREGLLINLRAAVAQARKTGGIVTREGVPVRFNGNSLNTTIRVIPLTLPSPFTQHYVVLFEEVASPGGHQVTPTTQRRAAATQEAERQRTSQLAQELEATKQYLQSLIERYEIANEELKSANEEILSSNEELQSTNEELETAKEELQSTNEELSSVNDELRQRNQELGEANNDLNNLFSSANLPIIALGGDLRIRRYTASAEKVLNVSPTDIGRPIGQLNLNFPVPDLEALILEAIDSVSITEREVQDHEGHWYCLRIRPYRTSDNRIDGAMLLFIDIDSVKDVDRLTSLLAEVDTARRFAEGVVERAPWPLVILDPQLRVIKANSAFYQVFRTSQADTEQQFIYTLGSGQWNILQLRGLLEDIIPQHSEFHSFEVTHDFPQLGERTVLLNARRIRRDEQETDTILLGIEDITEFRQAERTTANLREKEVLLREIYHRVKNNLQVVSSLLNLQAGSIQDPNVRELFQESQRRIQAMSLVHQKLYGSEHLTNINLWSYVQSLVGDLALMYETVGRIAFDIHVEGELDIDTAIPCGLILTELVSNALKYAFPAGQQGNISVTLRPETEDRWILMVQDDGVGIPPETDIAHLDSLGLNLVRDLASQLRGRVELDRSRGTTFTIHFTPIQHRRE
jgi:two-component system, chemotaxis family, CheB/CheR fusion protein